MLTGKALPVGRRSLRVRTGAPLCAFTFHWQLEPGRDSFTVVLKATADLSLHGPAMLRAEADPPNGDEHVDSALESSLRYPSDFAVFKPRCDVVLHGTAHPPRSVTGERPTETQVRLIFGQRISRTLAVFGPRRWDERGRPTRASTLEPVPLTWEHAFGGPGHDNPVGRDAESELVPCIEDPAQLIVDRKSRPTAAGVSAVPLHHPLRWSKLGTHDAAWERTHFPYFAADLDWAAWQCAPLLQQIPYADGREAFELHGLHPDGPIRGALPGVRPRCFAQRTVAAGAGFEELTLHLDTVIFDSDAMKVNLVWRGLVATADVVAGDLVELYAVLDDERSLDALRAAYHAELALVPTGAPERAENVLRAETPTERRVREKLEHSGIPIEPLALAPEDARWTPSGTEPSAADAPVWNTSGAAGRAQAEALLRERGHLAGAELPGADLSGMDLRGRSLLKADLRHANLAGAQLARANLMGAKLVQAVLDDAQLQGASVDLADLTGASLCRLGAEGASLVGADLSECHGAHADFRNTRGAGARLCRAHLAGARFDGADLRSADFSDATLERAVFDGAELHKVRLYRVCASGSQWRQAKLDRARADEAELSGADLSGASAERSVWDLGCFEGAKLERARLGKAGFVGARCSRASFAGADLTEARLAGAALDGAVLKGADLKYASLEMTDLREADVRGASLYGAETFKAKTEGALFNGAFLANTKLGARS